MPEVTPKRVRTSAFQCVSLRCANETRLGNVDESEAVGFATKLMRPLLSLTAVRISSSVRRKRSREVSKFLVRLAGVEPATLGLEVKKSCRRNAQNPGVPGR